MALVLADRVLETTSVAGTGDATLNGAQTNYQPFSVIGDGNTTYYTIVDNTNNEWEVGIGTYTLSGNKISRDTVLSSSNGGALVYFPSGDKDIFLDLPSEEVILSAGDVTGPASAVADNFAAFNMTTGKLINDSGYNASSFATAAQGAKADTAVQPGSLATVATTGAYSDLTGKPTLGTAAALNAGVAGGVATLDGGGTVPTSQLPAAVLGAVKYQGTWDASTNTPTLASGVGTQGYYYVVSVAGSTNLDGITSWAVGDWAIYNGTAWQKIDNTDAVTSVNGYTGTVVLTASDVGATPATSGTSILYGNGTGGTSNVTVGSGLTFAGGTLSASGGDVVGPSSATDNAIARFDTTTGKLIQNSVVTIDDSGNISGANSISTIDYAQLDTTAAASIALGKLRWNVDTATAAFGIIDGTTEVNIGQQMYAYVTNAESVTITAGQAVYLYQATGNRASVKLAYNTGDATSAKTLGLVTADITAGATGFVTTQGVLGKLNTGSYTEGDTLYLGATAGSLTATKPKAPNHLVYIGVVERANNGNGQIYVRVQNGYELDEIHDVQINSPANGQTILYDASTSLWKNANLTAGTGISISNGAASATITNSAPDQTVAITGAGGAVVTGTYPNFTITTPSGTVTSVTGTAPIASSGGATPAISISQATTSTDGYLSSTDWNTFNGKGSGTVTSVGGTGTVNGMTLTGTVTGSGNLTLGGTLGGIGNGQLINSAVTIGSTSVSLGATATSLSGLTSLTVSGVVGSASTGALTIPSGTTAQRPTPATGMVRYNSTLGVVEYYSGSAWYSITSSLQKTPDVEYLVVAGGGGGGAEATTLDHGGGGGGAGGFRTATGFAVTAGVSITVTVGAGGAGAVANVNNGIGASGSSSVFSTITSAGGGYGGSRTTAAASGGSGGGSENANAIGNGNTPSTSPSQGNNGGLGDRREGGGGGGASAVGNPSSGVTAGSGGAGTASSISGSSVTYAGGGGGGARSDGNAGAGGSGGGGAGSNNGTVATSGTANTGGGGGGGGSNYPVSNGNGGAGGSGVVIIRYLDGYQAAASTTGSPTVTVAGGYRVYKWTGSGSITF